nr:hypothetical protein [Desulfuromonas acetoxidans]
MPNKLIQRIRYRSPLIKPLAKYTMNIERTRELLQGKLNHTDPIGRLVHVLETAVELVSLPDNDFSWSSWESFDAARSEMKDMISLLEQGCLPERVKVSVLFAPTGPLQEVSLSSGWAETFLKVAEKYDKIEKIVWGSH